HDESVLGEIARTTQPRMRQVFFDLDPDLPARDTEDLRRRAYIVRKRLDTEGIYFPSLSPATITYKGMLSTGRLASYFTELSDECRAWLMPRVSSRVSTDTLLCWQLTQRLGTLAHNGEINPVRGHRNWVQDRQPQLDSDLRATPVPTSSARLDRLCPIVPPGA